MEETTSKVSNVVEAPLGIFQAKCDDKGRLKLPVDFVTYLRAEMVGKVFITTFNMKLARIYSKSAWERNQNLFENAGDDAEIAQDVAFIANVYGAYSEIDDNGRVLIPTELRRKLEFEGKPVWLDYYNGGINVFGKDYYDERMQRAMVDLPDKVKTLAKKGLK